MWPISSFQNEVALSMQPELLFLNPYRKRGRLKVKVISEWVKYGEVFRKDVKELKKSAQSILIMKR